MLVNPMKECLARETKTQLLYVIEEATQYTEHQIEDVEQEIKISGEKEIKLPKVTVKWADVSREHIKDLRKHVEILRQLRLKVMNDIPNCPE